MGIRAKQRQHPQLRHTRRPMLVIVEPSITCITPATIHTGRLTTTAVDVVFYRYRPAGARRLGFKEVGGGASSSGIHMAVTAPPAYGWRMQSLCGDVWWTFSNPASQFVEALAAVAYEAGLQFEDVMVALGCRGPNPLTPEGSAVSSCHSMAQPHMNHLCRC